MTNQPLDEEAIFWAALEKQSQEERNAFVEEACADHPDLLERVRELLGSHDESMGPLDAPIANINATLDQPITEKPGAQIGPYMLLQQLGAGGMGVVYMAEQKEPVKRRVALKIIKPGMDTRQVIARFEAERQALAMMDHPNIAKVLDAGQTESGRPYFVMELVKGMPVTNYCDEQHLTPKERLELFVPICQAVQHAHQKGIIHRDLKPSNILVALYDGRAVPKIIDFGVAKATSQTLTEKTMFTQVGQVVGTLEYMSPEQAQVNQLDIDTRSDIYSLGVVLYELLTGETPFDRERLRSVAFDEMLRIIREEEPSKPSTKVSSSESLPSIAANRHVEPAKLSSMIRGELDWIVLKAMEKDRARRYETASKFAEDVQHYLKNEAVVACPPSRVYRLKKFSRRHRRLLLGGIALVVLMMAGVTGTTWQAVRATHARDIAAMSEQRATANLALALRAVDQLLTRVGDETLQDTPMLEQVRRRLLEDAVKFYEEFLSQQQDKAQLLLPTAAAQRRLAQINVLLGEYQAARASIETAITILRESPFAAGSDTGVTQELATSLFLLGRLEQTQGDLQAARDAYEEGVRILEPLARETDDLEIHVELATSRGSLGRVIGQQGDLELAAQTFEQAEREFEASSHFGEMETFHHLAHAKNLVNFGGMYSVSGNTSQAEDFYRRAISIADKQASKDRHDVESRLVAAAANQNLARVLWDQEKNSQASRCFETSIAGMRRIAEDFPAVPNYRMRLAGVLMTAGPQRAQTGDVEAGCSMVEEAVAQLELLTNRYPDTVEYRHTLGGALCNLAIFVADYRGEIDRAEQLCRRAIEEQQAVLDVTPSDTEARVFQLTHYRTLAAVLHAAGKDEESSQVCDRALQLADAWHGTSSGEGAFANMIQSIHELQSSLNKN